MTGVENKVPTLQQVNSLNKLESIGRALNKQHLVMVARSSLLQCLRITQRIR